MLLGSSILIVGVPSLSVIVASHVPSLIVALFGLARNRKKVSSDSSMISPDVTMDIVHSVAPEAIVREPPVPV